LDIAWYTDFARTRGFRLEEVTFCVMSQKASGCADANLPGRSRFGSLPGMVYSWELGNY
jgi:hypothetical protein